MLSKLVSMLLALSMFNGFISDFKLSLDNINLEKSTRTLIATRALEISLVKLEENFQSINNFDSSLLVGMYLRQLSYPVYGLNSEYRLYRDPFPLRNSTLQISWVRRYFPEYTKALNPKSLLSGRIWKDIDPGNIIFLERYPDKKHGVRGLEAFIVAGFTLNKEPILVYLRSNASSITILKGFDDIKNKFAGYINPEEIMITIFDPLRAINNGNLWNKSGKVIPNSDILNRFDYVITVNIFDGTTAIFENTSENNSTNIVWKPLLIGDFEEVYAITGYPLPVNETIKDNFIARYPDQIYDSDKGVYISKYGVYQHSWTPQMIGYIERTLYLYGFGGLEGSTDILIIHPMHYNKDGDLIQSDVHSDFTLHKIPDVINYAMYARKDILATANSSDTSIRGPLPYPSGSVSSGCVNYDEITWGYLSSFIEGKISERNQVGVILSYPDFDQSLIPTIDLRKLPFTGQVFSTWCRKENCDWIDRRETYKGY